MYSDPYNDVLHFRKGCGLPVADTVPTQYGYPMPVIQRLSPTDVILHSDLIGEEVAETLDALAVGDVAAIADGIVDSIYVLLGLAVHMGLPFEALWNEVQAANMRKLDGPKRADGKQLKPPGWVGPDIQGVLEAHGWPKDTEDAAA